jgi:hypothetical protein
MEVEARPGLAKVDTFHEGVSGCDDRARLALPRSGVVLFQRSYHQVTVGGREIGPQ